MADIERLVTLLMSFLALSGTGVSYLFRRMDAQKMAEMEELRTLERQKLENDAQAWSRAKEIMSLQSDQLDKMRSRLDYLDKQTSEIPKLNNRVEQQDAEINRLLKGIGILVRQLEDCGVVPRWEPNNTQFKRRTTKDGD